MIIAKLGAALIGGGLILSCALSPASAASPTTKMFFANATPNVDFLDRSSRMALDNSKSAQIRAFAHGQAAEQTRAANALYDWSNEHARTAVASATGPDGAPLLTGRSVAVDGQVSQIVDNRLPLGQEDLDGLEGLNGKDFDDAYKSKQLDALTQMKTDYQDYVAKGDDADLKAIATRELPMIDHRIALLRKL